VNAAARRAEIESAANDFPLARVLV